MAEDPSLFNLSNAVHKRVLLGYIKSLTGIHRVEIAKVRDQRTLSQNAYMHGVLFVDAAKGLNEAWGQKLDMLGAKKFLKDRFLRRAVINGETGELKGHITLSTADLNVEECSTFIEQCIEFCMDELNTPVRTREEFEAAA